MLDYFSYLEADYTREYHIDLSANAHVLSWRRFISLFNGLSPESSFRLVTKNIIDADIRRQNMLTNPTDIADAIRMRRASKSRG